MSKLLNRTKSLTSEMKRKLLNRTRSLTSNLPNTPTEMTTKLPLSTSCMARNAEDKFRPRILILLSLRQLRQLLQRRLLQVRLSIKAQLLLSSRSDLLLLLLQSCQQRRSIVEPPMIMPVLAAWYTLVQSPIASRPPMKHVQLTDSTSRSLEGDMELVTTCGYDAESQRLPTFYKNVVLKTFFAQHDWILERAYRQRCDI